MKHTYTYIQSEISEIMTRICGVIAECAPDDEATLVTLSGDLGAGKTTSAQHIGKVLGVKEHITSPTYVIMKRYETTDTTWDTLIHIDAYRLSSWSDLEDLSLEEYIQRPKTLILMEWPEKVADMPHTAHAHLDITITAPEERVVILTTRR